MVGRITRRLLVQQHLHAHHQFFATQQDGQPVHVLNMHLNPLDSTRRAFAEAARACAKYYPHTPKLLMVGPPPPPRMRFLQSHVEYMLGELFKNAIRATVEFAEQQQLSVAALPPITVPWARFASFFMFVKKPLSASSSRLQFTSRWRATK